jgi:hypothetical protein
MGLAICRSIIDVREGRLWVAPNKPEGAVFQFTLLADGATSAASWESNLDDLRLVPATDAGEIIDYPDGLHCPPLMRPRTQTMDRKLADLVDSWRAP